MIFELKHNSENLRVIETSRDIDEINEYARKGFFPLIKEVIPNYKIQIKFAVYQNKKTGEIKRFGDFRSLYRNDLTDYEVIIPWTRYYPYHHQLPFAAYIIPKDIKIGERVFIKDIIEDIVASIWNQGDVLKLNSYVAVWDGEDLKIEFDEENDIEEFIG